MAKKKSRKSAATRNRRIYRNPPIHEAVCEFQFSNPENWSIAHSGLFLERVKKRYAGTPSEQRILRLPIPIIGAALVTPSLLGEITKVQLRSKDGREMVGIGPGILSIHSLKPYSGWEHFRRQIVEALGEYRRIASPQSVRRIGIRYINQIFIPHDEPKPNDFFTTPPYGIPNVECAIEAFATRYEYSLESSSSKAIVQMATIEGPPNTYGVALDIDVSRNWQGEPCKVQDALKAVDAMRSQEREIFEALIAERARELFDA